MSLFIGVLLVVLTVLVFLQFIQGLLGAVKQDTRLEVLTESLGSLTERVEQRLNVSFDKSATVFADVLARLAVIDKAQEEIAELSGNVVSLQEILSDKRSRGAFGEVQLNALISNILPQNNYALQYTFESGVRADCVLFMPEPTGTICIDSKFPLESYQRMTDPSIGEADRTTAKRQFKQDIKKHIKDIATKYIIPGTTSDSAVMFIPAEAVFAEIHGHHPELIAEAQRAHVWITSPTTMMAVLTTSCSVLKDVATRKQAHLIQEHLTVLAKDFLRFQSRVDKLTRRIGQAYEEVADVQISAQKITSRFEKIENVELSDTEKLLL